jgi:hypothetical protein
MSLCFRQMIPPKGVKYPCFNQNGNSKGHANQAPAVNQDIADHARRPNECQKAKKESLQKTH